MASYWVNFARTGDPNGPGLPAWPAFNAGGQLLVLGDTVYALPTPVDPQLRVFDAVYDAVRGSSFGQKK